MIKKKYNSDITKTEYNWKIHAWALVSYVRLFLLTWCFRRARWTPRHWTRTDPQSWPSSVGSDSPRRPGRVKSDCYLRISSPAVMVLCHLVLVFMLPAGETGRWGKGSPCHHPHWMSACCGCSPERQCSGINILEKHSKTCCSAISNSMTWPNKARFTGRNKMSSTGGHLTSSTVFLLFVSLRVSSTKLSQRPLQSSGSSVKKKKESLLTLC